MPGPVPEDSGENPAPCPPPAPWRFRGRLWAGLLPLRRPLPVPGDLRPLFSPSRLAVGLVRYREGTLRYDELAIGPLVRRGRRAGLLIDRIWVDDAVSVRGGRDIWGLPKELAEFVWTDTGGRTAVRVADRDGPLAELVLGSGRPGLPGVPLPLPGFSGSPGRRLFIPGRLRGTLRPGTLTVTSWSDRLPPLERTATRLAVAVRPFRMTVPGPVRR
ncbi:acetoacetate decarboxylase family protein [Streptomyces sp. TRM 70361]|uniref:acetoacetate decarboxylase family protein n=1 Tax=Streptomyces sp. TRM 70361 TaxID=3116553 RepID=UPI002E7C13A4|nr:acetoacetate decarboxylase family protein [Streptomyces sp. TRM 70361]MEE1940213.1 acetoacetate decarboxylase family protein [Streptomyces sp. TRM 70361]